MLILNIFLHLQHGLVDVNDGLLEPECLEPLMCEANSALMMNNEYDIPEAQSNILTSSVMTIVSSLLSNTLAKSFTNYDMHKLNMAVNAAQVGRNGTDCEHLYKKCTLKPQYIPQPHILFRT